MMKNAGHYLKSIREERGYSIQEVSKHTKISPSVLSALEEDTLKNIDQVYLKSFLKMYCRFLGVEWDIFQKEYPLPSHSAAKHLPKPPPAAQGKKERISSGAVKPPFSLNSVILKNKRTIVIVLLAIAGLFFLLLSLRGCAGVIKKLPRAKVSSNPKTSKPPAAQPPKQTKASSPSPAQVKEPPLTAKPVLEASQSAKAVLPPPPPAKESKPKDITLTIKAQEGSFLKVKVDGKTVYQGTLRKGKAESWTAKDKIELSVGNAGGIVLEANGRVFSPLGKRGQTIKSILINSEGLKIL